MLVFKNVDILKTLYAILEKNTTYYREDFALDQRMIEAVLNEEPENRTLLWLSRDCGTNCYRERDVFLAGSAAHSAWCIYADPHFTSSARYLAYAVEVKTRKGMSLYGDIYTLDYFRYVQHVQEVSVPASRIALIYEGGVVYQNRKKIVWETNEHYGKLLQIEECPDDPDKLRCVLSGERSKRRRAKTADVEKYISKLPPASKYS